MIERIRQNCVTALEDEIAQNFTMHALTLAPDFTPAFAYNDAPPAVENAGSEVSV